MLLKSSEPERVAVQAQIAAAEAAGELLLALSLRQFLEEGVDVDGPSAEDLIGQVIASGGSAHAA